MRRILVATLVLIPVLAQAQAGTSTEPQPSQASATLLARVTPPAVPASSDLTAKPSSDDAAQSILPISMTIRQANPSSGDSNYVVTPIKQDGSIDQTFPEDSVSDVTAARLIHVVQADLPPQEIAKDSDVTVHLTVDRNGVPKNLWVGHSTDSIVAERTLEAVSQYRFKPATQHYLPVSADVTIDVKIQR